MAWSTWKIDSGKNECDIWIQNLKLYQILTAVAYAAKQFVLKFGFSDKATKFEKIFVVLLTRVSCYVRETVYLSKSWRRFFKTNVVKTYYTNFNWANISIHSKFPPILFWWVLTLILFWTKKVEKNLLLICYCKSFCGHIFCSNSQMQTWFLAGKFEFGFWQENLNLVFGGKIQIFQKSWFLKKITCIKFCVRFDLVE